MPRHDHRRGGADVRTTVAILRRPVGVVRVGVAERVARPLRLQRAGRRTRSKRRGDVVGNYRLGRVRQDLLDLIGREAAGDDALVAGVERRSLRHRQH